MKCLIIEDELPAQRILQKYIQSTPGLTIVGICSSAVEANEVLQQVAVDLVFLDIHLPLLSGMAFLKTRLTPLRVIITTAYPDYAVESYELDAIDYLVKPFSFERFLRAINKVRLAGATANSLAYPVDPTTNTIFINADKTLYKVSLTDILYIESVKDYVRLVLADQKIMFLDSLRNWEEKLPVHQFLRIHKSFIVNMNKIIKVYGNTVVLATAELPIGRTYKDNFMKKIQT